MTEKETKIRILPEEITNKIAAGEVVERPSSVIKELIENSIDAGARHITLRLSASGLRLIEIIDDGVGMSEQDAILSIERHATSKISEARDLEAIHTFGFRGEALSSISAVSHFVLSTKRTQDNIGTQIVVHGGVLKSVSSIGCPQGTKISVNRLFFNTPVRLKFLKGLTTELSHCIDIVQKYALSHEKIGFKLFHNEKLLFDIPPEMDLYNRISLIWGKSTISEMIRLKEISNHLFSNESEPIPITIHGYIGLPSLTRSHRSHQLFFVNKRPIYSRTLQYSLEEAYRSLIMIGKYPIAILFLEIPPQWIDVNIHPTKKEIKFRDERVISKYITTTIRNHLSLIPEQKIHTNTFANTRDKKHTENNHNHPINIAIQHNYSNNNTNNNDSVQSDDNSTIIVQKENSPVNNDFFIDKDDDKERSLHSEEIKTVQQQPSLLPNPFFSEYIPSNEIPIQVFDSYLVLPEKDRLLIIDQHALHERLNFENLRKELQESNITLQRLVIPIIIEVPSNYSKILEEKKEVFQKIGIDIEPFGDNIFQITSICELYDEEKIKDTIFELLEEMVQGDLFEKENYFESLLSIATKACKKSIKAGDKLDPLERIYLIQGFKSLTPPYTCPHGRPILIELTIQQMEKSFRRRP